MIRILLVLISASVRFSAAEVQSAPPSDLTVHEWGTFTSVAGVDGQAVLWDALGGKDDLPGFVQERFRCGKITLRGTVRMETPVIYFYSPQELAASVHVSFPKGLITEWYPPAQNQVFQKSRSDGATYRLPEDLNGIDVSLRSLTGDIEWQNIKVEPNASPVLPAETAPSRYYAARGTDSAPVAAGNQHEKFLFYRGVGRYPVPLAASIAADGSIVVENRGAEPVPTLILFQNRGGQLGYRNAGTLKNAVTMDPPALDSSLPVLRTELEEALTGQGLFPKEAQAMVETWHDSWFEEGTRLIYIMPSRAVDAFLPLHITPAPSQIARVFVGRVELITPDMISAVESAIATGDVSSITRYGRFVSPMLDRVVAENPALENSAGQVRAKIWNSIGACR
jgi:hypothetical protein